MRIVQLMLLCFGVVLLTACGFGGSGSPAYFQIGGTLRGLSANQSVTLTNNHGKPLTLRANGNFQFAMPVAYGSSYSITVAQQPAGQICSVAAESGTRAGIQSNVDSIQIVCSTQAYTIGGTISGLSPGQSVTLLNNESDPLTLNGNSGFQFATPVADEGSYEVTVSTTTQGLTCSEASESGAGAGIQSNVNSIQIICNTRAYMIGGSISGLNPGQSVTLFNNEGDPLTLSDNGDFQFPIPVAYGGSYKVTVSATTPGLVCSPAAESAAGAGIQGNVNSIQIVCDTQSYTIGGSISGLNPGQSVTLFNNKGDPLALNANGSFQFVAPVAYGGSYQVTVSMATPGLVCSPAAESAAGAGIQSNINSIEIVCNTQSYTIGGSISGLSPGQSVTLLNNAGDPLELNANGNFQFSMPIAYGGSYQVTVSAATPGLICSEVADSDFGSDIQGKVNSVQIICSTQTFTIGGSIGIRNTRSVTLFNNGGDLLTLNRSGNFQFATPVAYGAGYRIQITTGVRNTVCYVATASQSRAIGTVTSNINDIMAGCGPWGGSMVPTNGLTFLVLVGSGPFISQWSLADAVCSSQVGGYRLPTLAELQAINGLPLTNLKAVYTSPVWTATAENSGSHDTFSLSTGMVSTPGDQSGQYALCVR